jgi:hypothetical protein
MISVPVEVDGLSTFENMHATCHSENSYVIENSPFYAYGMSLGDIVAADRIDGRLLFTKVLERGGHSTYRIKLPRGMNHELFLENWAQLEGLGCSYEGSTAGERLLYSIDMPLGVDVHAAYMILQQNEDHEIWEFEEVYFYKGASK